MTSSLRSSGFASLAFLITFGIVSALAAQPAAARIVIDGEHVEIVTEKVRVSDLDLLKASDRRRLDDRIRTASNRACASWADAHLMASYHECRLDARRGGEVQMARLIDRAQRYAAARSDPVNG